MKGGIFLGPARVSIQERETTAEGVHMKNVVWITEGTSIVRCAVQHLRSLSESEKRLCSIADTESISFQDLVTRLPHSTFLDLTTQTDAPDDAWEDEITGWDPRSTRNPSSGSSFWPHQSDATSRLGPDLMPPSRSMRTDDEMSVQEPETTHVSVAHPSASEDAPPDGPADSVEPEDSVQTTPPFKRPRNPLDRVEPPKRTRGDEDDHSAFVSAYHHDEEKVSENLKNGKSVFSGTGMPDMLDSAWLAVKTKTETQKSEPTTEAKSVEPLQKDVDNVLVAVSLSLDEETIQQICSNPDPETAFNVMVKRRRAEVKVSTLSAEHLSKRKTKNSPRLSNILWSKRYHVKGSHRLR